MNRQCTLLFLWMALLTSILAGCNRIRPNKGAVVSDPNVQQTYVSAYLDFEQYQMFLSPLGLENAASTPDDNGDILRSRIKGTPDQLEKAAKVLDVVDSLEAYCVENLGPASDVRTLPSNKQLGMALGDLNIGSFNEPPIHDGRPRAIIDIHGDAILAFIPVRYRAQLLMLLANANIATLSQQISPANGDSDSSGLDDTALLGGIAQGQRPRESALPAPTDGQATRVVALTEMAFSSDTVTEDTSARNPSEETHDPCTPPKTIKIDFTLRPEDSPGTETNPVTTKAVPDNGEDVLDLTLPETMTLIQLLDLAGKYLGLNYVYDPREINNQQIVLKLHGTLQGEMRVKNLYALLETTLDSMGLVMIRQAEDLVAVVSLAKALETQPELIDVGNDAIQIGDTVVTRVFDIQHVDISSVISLLENMKLSVAHTQVDKANLLLVTCHADRMNRIERLVALIDRPGKSIECRFRRLYYITASPLITKVRTLAEELEGITVATAPTTAKPSTRPAKPATASKPAEPAGRRPVYLDADERTNRILLIGAAEELDIIEELVDILDVIQEDLRVPHIYTIDHLDAQKAIDKLQELEVLKAPSGSAPTTDKTADNYVLTGEPLVAVLEATNQLLVKAAPAQHADIRKFLDYIDVTPEDTRTITAYELQHIDVHDAKEILEELDLVTANTVTSSFVAGPNQPAARREQRRVPAPKSGKSPGQASSVVVNESTNALLVKATAEQHARIAKMITYIDTKRQEEEFAYHIYPLESSSPGHLASLLEKLILDTAKDKDQADKIVRKADTSTRITIVPDPNTFSLIVYATQKNQTLIEDLINRLDKRRPQVLIDVTLVEITRADTFEYDLNLVANADDAVVGNLVIDAIQKSAVGSNFEAGFNLLDQNGNPTGQTKAFYSDEKVQALLTAMEQKNYGRVLAKPKVLVNDGNEGQIVATDETTYVKESIQIPQTGTPITTRDFVPIQASIELQITPHISEGNLLRLDVHLSRDDFGTRPLSGAPPDKASSEVTTTVFVPDDSTVILGGLVKLNQSKGGSKVPILGDIPLLGGLFRSVDNSDIEKKLYVFLKANVVKPYDESRLMDLDKMSREHMQAFEKSEAEFQQLQNIPGITPTPMQPERVLKDYR